MTRETLTPTVIQNGDETLTRHPAFGMVSVNRTSSGGTRLFASDLSHSEVVTMRFYEAEQLEQDGIQKCRLTGGRRGAPLLSVSLSPAQWAAMITSFGLGDGVPCTINALHTTGFQRLPEIGRIESTRERYERQIQEAGQREIAKVQTAMSALRELAEKGKAGKRELAEALSKIDTALYNLPGNLSFTTELIQENMDKVVASGKAELEAVALGVATRLGVKEISRLITLESENNG
ncbi:hypothetical protein KC222_00030 [Cedecea davisae]|uniref:Uncharacterized protein n=1 Tax=Cedecea davisae TaxID=158484 RepID=A0ABS6DCA4_9ENTR|nr:hypothetical protein [Cedecea davisae]MBU4680400.1 hypothetical protein [Cedecea davisae]MBU4685046.1 hypothetical protein [Cedecea davisae]